jgi:hypothetical protein
VLYFPVSKIHTVGGHLLPSARRVVSSLWLLVAVDVFVCFRISAALCRQDTAVLGRGEMSLTQNEQSLLSELSALLSYVFTHIQHHKYTEVMGERIHKTDSLRISPQGTRYFAQLS